MFGLKNYLKKFLPAQFLSSYHFFLSWLGAFVYRYPSSKLIVIGVTGSKGKTTVTELISKIFEEAGQKTALLNSIQIKVGASSEENTMRMSMPGRFFIQKFLSDAAQEGCAVAVLEMTSEGVKQSRHRFIELNALVFLNLEPEHIESHGSYQAYADAKFELARALARSRKRPRIIAANADDKESGRYLTLSVEHALPFSLQAQNPYEAGAHGGYFTFDGAKISIKLPGEFSLRNALAAATVARASGIPLDTISRALEKISLIPGRAEYVDEGQNFSLVVDYAHTPASLTALYETYKGQQKICVLGSTGGGRDMWKRPVMGQIAEKYCDVVILTDEDPYDEDPQQIVQDVAHGMAKKPEIVMDRRAAIRRGIELARQNSVVLITGKGTNHEICGPKGTVTPWSDVQVAREELKAFLKKAVS